MLDYIKYIVILPKYIDTFENENSYYDLDSIIEYVHDKDAIDITHDPEKSLLYISCLLSVHELSLLCNKESDWYIIFKQLGIQT